MDWVDVVRRVVPRPLRHAVQRVVSVGAIKRTYYARTNPLSTVESSDADGYGSPVRIGIIRDRGQYHTKFVQACLELSVPFRVIDITASDWDAAVSGSGCGLFFVWPDVTTTPLAKLVKDRCDLLEHHLGLVVVPSSAERWMYEDKIRLYDWLRVHRVPHPRTWIFFDQREADAFARSCELPIVFKTSFGAAASGVRTITTRRALRATVARAFGSGHVPAGYDRRDRQWDSLVLQEHLDVTKEWRLVRIGDAYFGHPKGRRGSFHSGSGRVEWDVPEARHLDLLHSVTELGGFRSMDVDVFETADGRLLVNELQAVFGASTSIDQLRVDGTPGRMVRAEEGWRFEPGDFARNACSNARILDALDRWPQNAIGMAR
jgi:hypothetical protein